MATPEVKTPKSAAAKNVAKKVPAAMTPKETTLLARTQKAGFRLAGQFGGRVTELQRKAFERVIDGVGELQDKTGERVHEFASESNLVPAEAAQLIAEWNKAVKQSRKDLEKTALKSFELADQFYARLKKQGAPAKAAAAKRPAKKDGAIAQHLDIVSPA